MDNRDNELFNGIIDVPNANANMLESDLEKAVKQDIYPQTSMEIIDVPMNNVDDIMFATTEKTANTPEIIDFDMAPQAEEVNSQDKVINHELLENLNKDTNNLVNPNMIINPLGKSVDTADFVNIEEPKVDYDEIKTKKGYVFMAIIFLIILLFIIFLPQIMAFIGI